MSTEAPSENKMEKSKKHLHDDSVQSNCDSEINGDEVDAAPSRRLGKRPEKDETDIDLHRQLKQLQVDSERHRQKPIHTNLNNNIPTNKTSHTLSKYVYDMHHGQRGMAVIINNINFHKATGMSKRGGSEKDADALEVVLRSLSFNVTSYCDLTVKKIRAVLNSLSRLDHSNFDCFLFVIMSHGEEDILYGVDDTMPADDITKPFKGDRCPSLAGKPKLFFIQACRGKELDSGVEIDGIEETDSGGPGERVLIPAEADFLVGYSSPPGYYAWRNQGVGAWFIQALISVLKDFGTELEIQQLMTRVNHIVAYEYMSYCSIPGFDQKKQVPCIVSTLTKELYFTPFMKETNI